MMEQAEQDLFSYCESSNIDISEIRYNFKQILKALCYLHNEKNITHNDLKLENILVFNK